MGIKEVLILLIGGGGIGSMVSAFLTRKTDKDKIEISLLDRAYEEIDRLNNVAEDLRRQLKKQNNENEELKSIINRLEKSIKILENEIKIMEEQKKKRGETPWKNNY